MKPYTPNTAKGRTIGRDDIHHKTADISRFAAKVVAKNAKHGARQEAKKSTLFNFL